MSERLRDWLRFDEALVPEVEEAYREFIRHSRPGVALCIAFAIAFVAAVSAGIVLTMHGRSQEQIAGPLFVVFGGLFYGIMLVAVVRSPLPVLGRMLAGAVNLPRAVLLAIGYALICVFIEIVIIATISAILSSHVAKTSSPSTTVDYFSGGVLAGLLMLVAGAPLAEEFLMQGWLQTRVARLGPFWAGVVTTIVFVLIHVPTSALDWTRGVALGTAAWFRATTRSMLACIVVHAANNTVFAMLLLAVRSATVHR